MVRIKPFAALRPLPNIASRVASPPYDVVDRAEAGRLAAGNPASFLHVIRSEIDLPEATSPYDDAVYGQAETNLRRLVAEGTLVRDAEPGLYLYRQVMEGRSQTGLVACCHIEDYARNIVRRHEKTRPEKEDDRTRHILVTGAQTGPVFATFRDDPAFADLVSRDVNTRPLAHFDAPDGVTHTTWAVADPQAYVDLFASMEAVYVADGHHRAASALRAGRELRAAEDAGEDAECNWFMVALFPASEVTILAYNRTVRDLGGRSGEEVLERLAEVGSLRETNDPRPKHPGTFGVYCAGSWRLLELAAASIDRGDPVASLDAALLQERVLGPVLGVGDPREDPRLDFVGGIRSTEELQQQVDGGEAAIAFSLHPTTVEQLLDVADAGLVMPPKSTWFEPKLRSGLFVHVLERALTGVPDPA
jgi:uncharacterized protein (DUF1015 family)